MRKVVTILCFVCASSVCAQQITFADILSAEKTPKIVGSKSQTQSCRSMQNPYSPLVTLDYTFFESYLDVIGSVGMLQYGYPETNFTPMGLGVEYELGWRFSHMIFFGAGIGVRGYYQQYSYSDYYGSSKKLGINLPLYATCKIYMVSDYSFSMSADFGLGGSLAIRFTPSTPSGIFLRCGLGFDVRRFNIGAGYEMMAKLSDPMKVGHLGYIKIGVIISK